MQLFIENIIRTQPINTYRFIINNEINQAYKLHKLTIEGDW